MLVEINAPDRPTPPRAWRRSASAGRRSGRAGEHGDGRGIKNRTAVVGIGQTAFGKGLPDTELSLACQAISLALDDAGIAPGEVDGLASFTMEPNREVDVARNVGLGDITFFSQVGYGGGAGCGVVGQAAMAVATGQCEVAVAWRARKRADKASRPWAQVEARLADSGQWTRPFGIIRPVDEIAMLTRRYMHEYGGTRDHLANVALAFRKHANRNPNATMGHKTMTRDDYMNARWISEPLCLFDNCLETDGALAVVIVSAERAQRPAEAARVHPRVRAGPAAAAPDDDELLHRRPAARSGVDRGEAVVGERRRHARRREGRAALRRVQPAHPAVARGLRLLRRAARAARSPTTATSSGRTVACRSTPRAAACRRRTCTASTSCSKACARSGARRPRRSTGADVSLVTSGEGVPTSAILFTKDA